MTTRRALFLDRDGTLMIDTGYVRDPADVSLLPGAGETLRLARELGFLLVLVSNQSGVARGIISTEQLAAVQARFASDLAAEGVTFDDVRFCVHGPDDGCTCRKPGPGMLQAAAEALGIDPGRSLMLGDRMSDVHAGLAAGVGARVLMTTAAPGDTSACTHVIASLAELGPILRTL